MDVDVSLRTNIDYVFTMRETILVNRQKLHKYYFGQYRTFPEFDRVMQACTQNYKCLVLDGTVASTDASDNVMWYKAATELPPFRLCKPIFWKLARKYRLSTEEIRKAQTQQFQLDAMLTQQKRQPDAVLVQTEDEHGDLVVD